ncbi:protein of unknown function [Roseateles sp. YR242]|uniref:zinc-dependent metalloprotease n=1 Tax=Roseateles sp. YR242 TaxID=1855305 RepID=UPI0008C8D73E|nr:zinc-dependent metalloprotease [Roseateles sp. YR242]SEK34483.1 protein of unknown function [Roseateles sp. YR242]
MTRIFGAAPSASFSRGTSVVPAVSVAQRWVRPASGTLGLVATAIIVLSACATSGTTANKSGAAATAAAQAASAPRPAPTPASGPVARVPLVATPAASGASAPAVQDPTEPKPYDKVITADAKTQDGLFKLHTIKTRLYFEIPKALLDQPLLMVLTATQVPAGVEHVGRALNEDVVRFVQKNNRLYLQQISHAFVADPAKPNADAVQRSQRDPILASFPIDAFSKDGAPVIEVSRLFLSEVGDFSARTMLRGSGPDPSRSYIDQTKAFPGSVRIDAVQTYQIGAMPMMIPGMPVVPAASPARAGSVNVAYNIVKLPETPMRPRFMDDRIGYFSVSRVDFGASGQELKRDRLITRWRLEKKEPDAALSEPVKPIVWYIDSATPAAFVPYVKRGVEAWNKAFEAAGFKNAVVARPFPTKEEDPEFDPEDVRYSIIRWVPSPIPNAYGPHLSDPRSGEILNANVVMFHNILQLQRDWYVTQVGAADPRARKLPLPDDLMGDLVTFVVSHEVGHALGFPHNMKSSSLYPVEKLRDPEWLRTMGHVPSLMDYSRFNYLVQPEDKVDPTLLIPGVGPYDVFATRWGYTPIPSAATPEDELPTLNAWAREQDTKPWLRFSSPKADGGDAGENVEAVGDADPITATTLGVRNLKRIIKQLPALTPPDGQDDRTLEALYRASAMQWAREISHVVTLVGGYRTQNKHNDQPGPVAEVVPKAEQAKAVKLLNEQLFATPQWLLEPTVTQRLRSMEPNLTLQVYQRSLLRYLLDGSRTRRLQDQSAQLGDKAYGVDDLLHDVRRGIFTELYAGGRVSTIRRNLQRGYLELLAERVMAPGATLDDSKPLMREEMKTLRQQMLAAAAKAPDAVQRAHWAGLADYAIRVLDPRGTGSAASPFSFGWNAPEAQGVCWENDQSWFDALVQQELGKTRPLFPPLQ